MSYSILIYKKNSDRLPDEIPLETNEVFKKKVNPKDDFIIKRLDFVIPALKKINLDEVREIYLG